MIGTTLKLSSAQQTPLRILHARVPKAVGRCPAQGLHASRPTRTRAVAVSAQRVNVKPFNGCNCYYLLTNAKKGYKEGNDLVLRTLDQIKEVGFTVIRTWAFQDDPDPAKGGALQYKEGEEYKYNQDMMDGLTWLLNECQKRGLQLMLCLTNGNPEDYGGMRQYVRWSQKLKNRHEGGPAVANSAFFHDLMAQQLYKNYLKTMITKFRDHSAVHSWDLANEPRCQRDVSGQMINNWIADTAAFVKGLDPVHPVTVGVEGFFGPTSPGLCKGDQYNPFWGEKKSDDVWVIEGCDFVGNFKCPFLDFACIHLYPSNWNISDSPRDNRTKWSVKWIKDHINACKDPHYGLDNIPLVLQEFNLNPNDDRRTEFFKAISDLMVDEVAANGILRGSMVWCMCDPSQAQYDSEHYYLYARSVGHTNNAINPENDKQIKVLEDLSAKMKPAAS